MNEQKKKTKVNREHCYKRNEKKKVRKGVGGTIREKEKRRRRRLYETVCVCEESIREGKAEKHGIWSKR